MKNLLIQPPIAFLVILIFSLLMSFFSAKIFTFKSKNNPEGKRKPYACGEDICDPKVQPDFGQFFPFAFFFTIMHVLALIITTAPAMSFAYYGNALFYIAGAFISLLILFRK